MYNGYLGMRMPKSEAIGICEYGLMQVIKIHRKNKQRRWNNSKKKRR